MTVAQLIAELCKLPSGTPVYRDDGEFGPLEIECIEVVSGFVDYFTLEPRPPGVVIK